MITNDASTTIGRSVADVFAYTTDPANDPRWRSDVLEARRVSVGAFGRGSVIEWTVRFMGRRVAQVEVVEYEPERRVRYKIVGGTLPVKPTITYSYEPADAATRFTRRVELEPTGLFRLMAPMMRSMVSRQNAEHVAALKRELEG
jgi:uncharacterized protein YndB with AHSA1/START domain